MMLAESDEHELRHMKYMQTLIGYVIPDKSTPQNEEAANDFQSLMSQYGGLTVNNSADSEGTTAICKAELMNCFNDTLRVTVAFFKIASLIDNCLMVYLKASASFSIVNYLQLKPMHL